MTNFELGLEADPALYTLDQLIKLIPNPVLQEAIIKEVMKILAIK